MSHVTRRGWASLLVVAIASVALFGLQAWRTGAEAPGPADTPAAHISETVVRDLIELRRAGSLDADAYARALETTSIIVTLVGDTVEGEPAVPVPREVFLYTLADDRSEVVVVWGDPEGFDGWPSATAFLVRRTDDGAWRVADALPLDAEAVPDVDEAMRATAGGSLRLFTN